MKKIVILAIAGLTLSACASSGNFRAVTTDAQNMSGDQYKMALLQCNGEANKASLKSGGTVWNMDAAIYDSMKTSGEKDAVIMGCMADKGFVWDKNAPRPTDGNPLPANSNARG